MTGKISPARLAAAPDLCAEWGAEHIGLTSLLLNAASIAFHAADHCAPATDSRDIVMPLPPSPSESSHNLEVMRQFFQSRHTSIKAQDQT